MKTRLLLLLIAAATLCGCDRLGHRLTYYTYINATDKTVVVTLYDQDFYTDDWKVEVNPDAKEVFRFCHRTGRTIHQNTAAISGYGKKSFSPPFKDIEEAHCITVSNGEKIVSHRSPDGLFYQYGGYIGFYEETKSTNKSVHLQCVFDDDFLMTSDYLCRFTINPIIT